MAVAIERSICARHVRFIADVCIAMACALAFTIVAEAAETDSGSPRYHLKIEPQPLGTALQEFAKQSGLQIIFFSRAVEGREAPALDGNFGLAAALERLLAGSGLTYAVIDDRAVEIRSLPANNEQKVARKTTARQSRGFAVASSPMEEVLVIGTAEQLVATRVPTPLREIPQTVSIASPEQLRQQNATDLADVLRRATGVTTARNSTISQDFLSRGYEITSFHVDGGAALNPSVDPVLIFLSSPDLSEFEHVEVLRGSDALFGGNGNPGGTVSLVRKRPADSFEAQVSMLVGSWDTYRVEADVTGPLTKESTLRGRLGVVYSDRDFFYDVASWERRRIFGAVEYDITPDATLTLGASYQSDDVLPFIDGLPLYSNGDDPRMPRNTALTFDWAYYQARVSEAYLQYRQQFADDWTLKVNTAGWRAKAGYAYGLLDGLIDPITQSAATGSVVATPEPGVHTLLTADATLTGEFNWFGWREQLAFGGDFTRLEYKVTRDGGGGLPLEAVRAFNPRNYPKSTPSIFEFEGHANIDQYGVFASMRVYFNDRWSAVGGARSGSDHSERALAIRFNGVLSEPLTTSPGNSHVITPYAGLIYDIGDRYSAYISYADIYLTTGVREKRDGGPLGPARGANTEIGIKGAWREGILNGALVFYEIAQRNVPIAAPVPPSTVTFLCCWVGGTSRSRGVDLELNGEVAPGWLIGGGYTYNSNEGTDGETLSTTTPEHLLKLWMSKQLPGYLNRWNVGGSLHAQSKTRTRNNPYCSAPSPACDDSFARQGAYAVLDVRAEYEIDPHWRLALSLNNALDETYYESIDSPAMHAWYGEPRNLMLRIDGRY